MKRFFMVLAVAGFLGFGFAACGGGSDDASSTTQSTSGGENPCGGAGANPCNPCGGAH